MENEEGIMTIKRILIRYLARYRYDGLQHDGGCSCQMDNLFSCGEPKKYCYAVYRRRPDSDGICHCSINTCWTDPNRDMFCVIQPDYVEERKRR
jgi:hypothetical protein